MRYFLTGASGFVGGQVARQLVKAGHQVAAVVRDPHKASDLAGLGLELYQGDVTEKESMRAPMTGADGVFHIAGWYKIGARDTSPAWPVNLEGTRNVLELMRELHIPKGVYTSTLAINSDTGGRQVNENYRFRGEHLSLYDRTKAEAHALAEEFIRAGLPLVIVQPGLVYGPGDTSAFRVALLQYLRRRLPLLPQKTAYSWGYIEDVAQGHILAMQKGVAGQNYFICGPSHTLIEAMQIAESISGVPAPRLHAPPGMLKAASGLMGIVGKVVPLPETYTREGLRITAGVTYLGDNAKARRELGYAPRSLEAGLRVTLAHEMHLLGMR